MYVCDVRQPLDAPIVICDLSSHLISEIDFFEPNPQLMQGEMSSNIRQFNWMYIIDMTSSFPIQIGITFNGGEEKYGRVARQKIGEIRCISTKGYAVGHS